MLGRVLFGGPDIDAGFVPISPGYIADRNHFHAVLIGQATGHNRTNVSESLDHRRASNQLQIDDVGGSFYQIDHPAPGRFSPPIRPSDAQRLSSHNLRYRMA